MGCLPKKDCHALGHAKERPVKKNGALDHNTIRPITITGNSGSDGTGLEFVMVRWLMGRRSGRYHEWLPGRGIVLAPLCTRCRTDFDHNTSRPRGYLHG